MVKPLSFLSSPSRCEYLHDRVSQMRYELEPELAPVHYMERLSNGWRRFGYAMFRPECPACSMCESLRVPVDRFRPSASQRRVWNRNQDLAVRVGTPSITRDRIALWHAFHAHGEATKGWPAEYAPAPGLMLETPFPIEEWTYVDRDRLIGVGYVDALAEGLSGIYFYWDPTEGKRSLGTFNVLNLIASAGARALPHAYLGYYVRGCRSLEYKARFQPCELLQNGRWVSQGC